MDHHQWIPITVQYPAANIPTVEQAAGNGAVRSTENPAHVIGVSKPGRIMTEEPESREREERRRVCVRIGQAIAAAANELLPPGVLTWGADEQELNRWLANWLDYKDYKDVLEPPMVTVYYSDMNGRISKCRSVNVRFDSGHVTPESVQEAATSILSLQRDILTEITTIPWPPLDTTKYALGCFASPCVEVRDGKLRLWFATEDAPIIPIAEVPLEL